MSEQQTTFKVGDPVVHRHKPNDPTYGRGVVTSLKTDVFDGRTVYVRINGNDSGDTVSDYALDVPAKSENPKAAFGNLKTPALSVIPSPPLLQVGEVMRRGAEKYGAYNWRESRVNTSTYIDAAMRHLMSYQDGETLDPDDNQSHLAHAAASLFVIMDALAVGNATDDRPKPGVAADFIAAMAASRSN